MRMQNGLQPPMAERYAASRPRLSTQDRLITLVFAVGVVGVQGTWTVFLGWMALHLLW